MRIQKYLKVHYLCSELSLKNCTQLMVLFFFSSLEVLVHGSAEATEHLKQHCLKHVCPHVYAPQIGETIDVTSDLCAYKVCLKANLMLL